MISFISQETYEAICKQWVHTLLLNSESQIHIWPPLSCAYSLLHKFSQDEALQKQLFGDKPYTLIYIDGYESADPQWSEFESQFFHSIHVPATSSIDMDQYLASHPDRIFGIFLVGYDNAIKHDNTTLLKHVGALLEKHNHLSVIFLSEQNIPESPVYSDLIKRHMLVENIFYQKVYNEKDITTILSHLEKTWHIYIPQTVKQTIIHTIGGHPMLVEEAVRIFRDNPEISTTELLANPHLVRKAITIFKALSQVDQETLRNLFDNKKTSISEYLIATGLVKGTTVQLPYWQYMYNHFPNDNIFHHTLHPTLDVTHYLTYKEHEIYQYFVNHPNMIISREDIAKIIWKDMWEDKYSEWAIDQVIHRLRSKLSAHHMEYTIKTKKGEGFLMLTNYPTDTLSLQME